LLEFDLISVELHLACYTRTTLVNLLIYDNKNYYLLILLIVKVSILISLIFSEIQYKLRVVYLNIIDYNFHHLFIDKHIFCVSNR
jgi:hypothetical protein